MPSRTSLACKALSGEIIAMCCCSRIQVTLYETVTGSDPGAVRGASAQRGVLMAQMTLFKQGAFVSQKSALRNLTWDSGSDVNVVL
jgi:hypothetical protein